MNASMKEQNWPSTAKDNSKGTHDSPTQYQSIE